MTRASYGYHRVRDEWLCICEGEERENEREEKGEWEREDEREGNEDRKEEVGTRMKMEK